MRLSINPFRLESWFNGAIHPVLDLLCLADRLGIDAVTLSEHVVMGTRDIDNYPFAPSPQVRAQIFTEATDFPEPVVVLATIGALTRRIRLSTGVLLAPLRPAALLAKQLATLDVLTRGRLEISIGVGWQKVEYEALGVPWDGRFGRLVETAEACRALWSRAAASYHGAHVAFDDIYCRPFPAQAGGPPIWFGIGPSERNIERIARYADGWTPINVPLDVIATTLGKVRALLEKFGRDPASFRLRVNLNPIRRGDRVDLDRSLEQIPALANLGCTDVNIVITGFCRHPDEYQPLLEKYLTYGNTQVSAGV